MSGGLESLEQLSSWGASTQNIGELTEEAMTEVYNKYSFQMKEDTNNLAINEYKQQVMWSLHNIVVICICVIFLQIQSKINFNPINWLTRVIV